MKRVLPGLGVLLLVLAGGWLWLSPIGAMHTLKLSAQAGDREALAQEVDFPAVRQSLKDQLNAAVMLHGGDHSGGPGALGALFVAAIGDRVVDAVISPDGIGTLVAAGRLHKPGQDDDHGARAHWVITRHGLNRFAAQPVRGTDDHPPTLVFTRTGLSWRLTDIVLPVDTAK